MPQQFVVILAGGKGERFWPLSRESRPKQLLPIVGKKAMLAQTLDRVLPLVPRKNIFIITNASQAAAVRRACPKLPAANIVAEPVGRDSGPAVGLAAELVGARDPDAVFASVHADAAIHDLAAFQADLKIAFAAAALAPVMVTIGVPPTEPSTGYGYIQRGTKWRQIDGRDVYNVARFVEKPSVDLARKYLAAKSFYWNTGMFVWSVRVVREAFAKNASELHAGLSRIGVGLTKKRSLPGLLKEIYPSLPRIAVDYALLEKARNVVVLPASFDWDDVGAWPAVARHHDRDASGNVVLGHGIVEQGGGNIVVSKGRHLTAVLGADNLIVVHTPDATLVCPREKAQEIKLLLKRLKADAATNKLL